MPRIATAVDAAPSLEEVSDSESKAGKLVRMGHWRVSGGCGSAVVFFDPFPNYTLTCALAAPYDWYLQVDEDGEDGQLKLEDVLALGGDRHDYDMLRHPEAALKSSKGISETVGAPLRQDELEQVIKELGFVQGGSAGAAAPAFKKKQRKRATASKPAVASKSLAGKAKPTGK